MSDRRGAPSIEGNIQHHGHFAFLLSEAPGQPDVYLRGPSLKLAMNGDRVVARITGSHDGRRVGEIVSVVKRARSTVTGLLRKAGKYWAIVPENGDEKDAIECLRFSDGVHPREGALATLRIERWPDGRRAPGGTVTAVLGDPRDRKARMGAILAARDIVAEFPDDVLEQAEPMPQDPAPEDWEGRPELFDLPVFTIDGADAKDFDDAVSVEPLGGGRLRLGVHIADVAHYVAKDSPLDREARRRATSVYLPGRVIPMLPPKLSDHLCSLRPDVPRLTLTCWIETDEKGAVHGAAVQQTVIRSCRRFTYEEVQDLLDGKAVERVTPEVAAAVKLMGRLSKAMTAARMKRGALDFTVPEYKVVVGPTGDPIAVEKRPRLDSHRLIEEFMLAANEAVARTLSKARLPFLRRLHEDPDPEKLATLQEELGKLGLRAKTSLVAHPVEGLQSLLKMAAGHPFEETASMQIIRSLKLAKYSPDEGGHFGLASKDYCHFTSPIRRYPDLFTHRALKGMLTGRPRAHAEGVDAAALGEHCSERERLATEAERKSVDLARAQLLGREVGRTFDAVALNSVATGTFVGLPESGASGMLRGGSVASGTRLKVKLISADPVTGRLEFELVKDELPNQVRLGDRGRRRPK